MKTRAYKLYAATTTATNAAASFIVQRDGFIHGFHGSMVIDATADNHYCYAEVSNQSVSQATTNDTLGPMFELREYHNVGAAGVVASGQNSGISGLSIPVKAGDRIYLNILSSACNGFTTIFVYIAE